MDGEAIRELRELIASASNVKHVGDTPFFVNAHGTAVDLSGFLPHPTTTHAQQSFSDVASFVAYVNKFKQADTMLVMGAGNVLANLDYHSAAKASHCRHTSVLKLTRPAETEDWLRKNGKLMEQADFADFVEDHLDQIEDPNGATLMEIVNDFRVKTDARFESKISQSNGNVKFNFSEEHNGTYGAGSHEVPKQFTILLVPYIGIDEGVLLTANLRWRISGGNLQIGFKIPALEKALREIDDKVRDTIGGQVGIPVYK